MKGIFLTKYGNSESSFEIRELDIPVPDQGEVVIKVESFGLNFADVIARRGLYPDAPKNPALLGYDVAGTIHAVGAGVDNFKTGQRVTALTRFGGYAEYAKTIAEGVSVIPDSIDFPTATALSTQACTAYYCAEEAVHLHHGDHVLVQAAAGGVGIALVQIAKSHGCIVYGTASSKKQEFLKEIGVDIPIDYTKSNFTKDVRKHLGEKKGLDVVFDSIGGKTFSKGFKLLGPAGRMVSFGAASQIKGSNTSKLGALRVAIGFGLFSPITMIMKSQAIIGVNMLRIADHRPHVFGKCLDGVVEMARKGIIKPTIARVFKAEQIAEAHYFLESRQSIGKIAMEW
jgi:NADPH2:quinone reductase